MNVRRQLSPVSVRLRSRRGAAMFMALGALVIIGVLVAASSMISMQENRLGQNQLVQARAFAVAEYGLNRIQEEWDRTPNLDMPVGDRFATTYTTEQGTANVHYVRLNNETFWIVSEGLAMVGDNVSLARQARKRIGAILRLRIPTLKANAAVTTAGNIYTNGNPELVGTNTFPPNWTGCAQNGNPDTLSKAGVVASPTATVSIGSSKNVVGSPQVERDEVAADASTYIKFGDETWNSLRAGAITLPSDKHGADIGPAVTNGVCDRSILTNWGEPWRSGTGYKVECENYMPIIYAPGSLTLTGNGRGQGILLVEENFSVAGKFEFYGLVVAGGSVTAGNGTAKIYGAVMAASGTLDAGDPLTSSFTGTIDIYYSQCGLERAMRGSAQVVQAKERAWTELY